MAGYKVISVGLALVLMLTIFAPVVQAQNVLMDALKIFGIGYVVSKFGGQINKFINNVADQKGIRWEGTTKVVPIVSIGSGLFVGATQVVGPPDRVGTVKAVAQFETRISNFRGMMLIPISTSKVSAGTSSSGLSRVEGVGTSALIDFRI